jgi:hypothetical protein
MSDLVMGQGRGIDMLVCTNETEVSEERRGRVEIIKYRSTIKA